VTVDTTDPAVFALTSPADGSTAASSTPTFTWAASADANLAGYILHVGSFTTNLPVGTTTFTAVTALADGSHNWYVEAVDAAGNLATSAAVWSVIVDAQPDKISGPIVISDGIHDYSVATNDTTTTRLLGENTGISITVPMGGVAPGSILKLQVIIGAGTASPVTNWLTADKSGSKWTVTLPVSDGNGVEGTEGHAGEVVEFHVFVDGTPVQNDAVRGFTLKLILAEPSNTESFAVYNNVMTRGSGQPVFIRYELPKKAHVQIGVYTINMDLVKQVVDDNVDAGTYVAEWDGKNMKNQEVGQGVYFLIGWIDSDVKDTSGRKRILKVMVK
jgi:hypothetical protein